MGHLSTSLEGFELLKSHNLLGIIIELVQNCPVYSIRATAFYVLGLIGTTRSGAEELFTLGASNCFESIKNDLLTIFFRFRLGLYSPQSTRLLAHQSRINRHF